MHDLGEQEIWNPDWIAIQVEGVLYFIGLSSFDTPSAISSPGTGSICVEQLCCILFKDPVGTLLNR